MLRVSALDPVTTTVAAVGLGMLAGFASLFLWWRVFYNTLGPLDDHRGAAVAVALLATAATGVAGHGVARLLLRRWWPAAVVATLLLVLVAVVLGPDPMSVEHTCSGWELEHYSPGDADGAATTYCLGFETALPQPS